MSENEHTEAEQLKSVRRSSSAASAAGRIERMSDTQAAAAKQAGRYLAARFGPDWLYRAPETFENLVERWIWSVASGLPDFGETCITAIEAHCAERED